MENLNHQSDDDNGDDGSSNEDEFYMDEPNYQFDDLDEERQIEADDNIDYGNFDDEILRDDKELNRSSAGNCTTTPKQLLITDYTLLDPNYKRRSEMMESRSKETKAHTSKGNSRFNKSKVQRTNHEKTAHDIPLTKKQSKRLRKSSKSTNGPTTTNATTASEKNKQTERRSKSKENQKTSNSNHSQTTLQHQQQPLCASS